MAKRRKKMEIIKRKKEINIRDPAYVEAVRKKHRNKVAGRSRDRLLTFKPHFFVVSTKMAKFLK